MLTITQTQISAFERCPRFYYLKSVRRLVWPVETGKPLRISEGEDFHLLIRQIILGFSPENLIVPGNDEKVKRWLDIFLQENPLKLMGSVTAEKEVSLSFAEVLWLGKFDALAIDEDRITIFDWKTGAVQPDRNHFLSTPQTRLYRFLARSCAARLLGSGPHLIPADNIEMVYWFPEHPDQTIRLPYSEEEYQQDMTYLRTRAAEMSSDKEEAYPRTGKARQCEACVYRTYCFPETIPSEPFREQDLIPDEVYQSAFFPVDMDDGSDQFETIF